MVVSSDTSWFSNQTNQGGPEHLKARDRIMKLLQEMGFHCLTQQKFDALTPKGLLTYEPDILAMDGILTVVVEIDGRSHWSRVAQSKDRYRKEWFREQLGFPTVRYETNVLVGKKRQDDDTLRAQFWWGINN